MPSDPDFQGLPLRDLSVEQIELAVKRSGDNIVTHTLSNHLSERVSQHERFMEAHDLLSSCVVGISEHWKESNALMKQAIPWFDTKKDKGESYGSVPNFHEPVSSAASQLKKSSSLSDEHMSRIASLLESDLRLYARGREVFVSQLLHFEVGLL